MILIGLVIMITVLIVFAVPRIGRKLTIPDARRRTGSRAPRTPAVKMTALTSRDVEAADMLALARLDDDGAPPAPAPQQASDSHDLHALRQGHPGRVDATRAEPGTTAPGEAVRTPALPGTG